MGASSYFYFTPYQDDLDAALQALREKEFEAGRYDPAMQMAEPPSYMFLFAFPPDDRVPGPGPQHASIEDALEAAAESGTRSILDIMSIAHEPEYSAACPLPSAELEALFGTDEPSRDLVDEVLVKGRRLLGRDPDKLFWDRIERGQGRYIVVYDGAEPDEIFFAGMSWD
ncbi:MAG: hypothetical protein ABSG76_15405 [Xanthobacteraceae bacterium]|jgi:hypothetical protein